MHHILTHPAFFNYGGILQAYALQSAAHKLENPCSTIDYLPIGRAEGMWPRSKLRSWPTFLRMIFEARKEQIPQHLVPLRHAPFKKRFMHLASLKGHHNVASIFSHTPGFYSRKQPGMESSVCSAIPEVQPQIAHGQH